MHCKLEIVITKQLNKVFCVLKGKQHEFQVPEWKEWKNCENAGQLLVAQPLLELKVLSQLRELCDQEN